MALSCLAVTSWTELTDTRILIVIISGYVISLRNVSPTHRFNILTYLW